MALMAFALVSIGFLQCNSSTTGPSSPANSGRNSKKPLVVVTTGMIADLVRQIGGDTIEVRQLLGSGIDPHLYRPSRDDAKEIMLADLVFYNGLKLEGRMGDLLSQQPVAPKLHVAVSDALPRDVILGDPAHEAADPHIWMDVSMWAMATKEIEGALAKIVPDKKNEFESRGMALRLKLADLDALGMQWLSTIPESKRILITSHDAFHYFGNRYGLRVEGVQGVSTSSEAGLKRIRELVDLLHEKGLPAAFVESSVPGDSIEAIIKGAEEKGTVVKIGGELYSDAMGPPDSGADTYEGMMRHNFKTITEALGGVAAEPRADPAHTPQ